MLRGQIYSWLRWPASFVDLSFYTELEGAVPSQDAANMFID